MMENAAGQHWFLRKHEDATIFGPISFAQLARWASDAQIAPNDSLSTDATNWIKAPMLPELGMDWIVEVTSERYYGPTTLGAINGFVRLEEIDDETFVINACDGTRQQLRDIAQLLQEAADAGQSGSRANENGDAAAPAANAISVGLEDRLRELEQALREERRALHEMEERYRDLELRYSEVLNSRSGL